MINPKRSSAMAALISLAAFSAAQAAPVAPAPAGLDPLEAANRAIFAFNRFLDKAVIRPVAVGYKRITPRPLRVAVHNFANNLGEPVVAINDFLQGRTVRGAKTLTRFATNSTLGVLGVFDLASAGGIPHHANDFGMTLARYGVKPGPYLVLPVLGPSSLRDAAGSVATIALNPFTYVGYPGSAEVGPVSGAANGVEERAAVDSQLKTLYASATDPYAYMRSLYLQHRQAQINDGRVDVEMLPAFGDETADAAGSAPAQSSSATEPSDPVAVVSTGSPGAGGSVIADLAPGEAGPAPATEDRLFTPEGTGQ